MSGKQAKILAAHQIDDLLLFAETTRYPVRDRVIVLLSMKAGLRAAEIASLTWEMVLDPEGCVCTSLELRDTAAKMGHGRVIPLHSNLRNALIALKRTTICGQSVILSERGNKMKARSIVIWFSRLSLGQQDWFTKSADRCATFSCLPVIAPFKLRRATSTAIATLNGGWYLSSKVVNSTQSWHAWGRRDQSRV
jgi:integrase